MKDMAQPYYAGLLKLFVAPTLRYSEDIDLVQIAAGPEAHRAESSRQRQ